MASGQFDPEKLAKILFILTIICVATFAGAVILFVL